MTKSSGALQVNHSNGRATILSLPSPFHSLHPFFIPADGMSHCRSGIDQVLDIGYLDITEAHVSKLAESHLTSNCLTWVRPCKSLPWFVVSLHVDLLLLPSACPFMSHYSCLNLEGNNLATNGTKKLAQLMLKHLSLPNLAELNLRACQITDDGMKALAEGLLVKRNIRKLNLRYVYNSIIK